VRNNGLLLFLAGIGIAIVSTVPYLFVMMANDDPMMSKPTPEIILFLAGGVLGFICLVCGLIVDGKAAGQEPRRKVNADSTSPN
jgi:hypothetical protein